VAIITVPVSFIETEFHLPAVAFELQVAPESVDSHKYPVVEVTELVSAARITVPVFDVAIEVQFALAVG
jgi:hypothetical protein